MSRYIIPECYGDTELISILGFRKANHSPSIGAVANTMQKFYSKKLAIGVIDDDKTRNVPNYFNDFEDYITKENYKIKRLPESQHFIIVLIPALESFLLNISAKLNVSPEDFGFNNLESLKAITKGQKVSKNTKFKSFVNSLSQKQGSPLIEIKDFLNKKII